MEDDNKTYYSNSTSYAYDKYFFGFNTLNRVSVYDTVVTEEIKYHKIKKVYTIGLKYAPKPKEVIRVGVLKIGYVVTDVWGYDRKENVFRYVIERIDGNTLSKGVDGVNAPVGSRVLFQNRLTRAQYRKILAEMH